MERLETLFYITKFPAGEPHIEYRGTSESNDSAILVEFCRDFNDLGILVTAADILKRLYIKDITWFVPYFPFARHDRRRYDVDGLELKVAMEMVKDLDILIADPHSDVVGQLRHIPQSQAVKVLDMKYKFLKDKTVVIPDYGATKKAHTWLSKDQDVVQGAKVRDPANGNLSGFSVDRENFQGKDCVIVDDICDGGGTFIGLAKELKVRNAGSLSLVVTHGLFTKGVRDLLRYFDNIYTYGNELRDGVKVLPYEGLYYAGGAI